MLLRFATKRNPNGYRKHLNIDTINKVFSRDNLHWLCREDFTEISTRDRNNIISKLLIDGFVEVDKL